MSERAYLIRELPDGSVEYTYLHDGRLDHAGPILQQSYSRPTKAARLIALGWLSSLGHKTGPGPGPGMPLSSFAGHPYAVKERVAYAYHRDDGRDWEHCRPHTFPSFQELVEQVDQDQLNYGLRQDIDHLYCYGEGGWLYYKPQSGAPVPLGLALAGP